ncbi:ABC transporter permease [Actinocorallia sp. API 0066]|uniref:ABC transporter permease n=1 Tax=Actinocorallia sp. API 0066 TaxID=2896846 RepID=UPI001E5A80A4|nr:ABC transporter permease [Actinocorallia sp. API 0066]MCD0448934.1 ABC transporter permease [Actinocorallia sp. API 0066]
MTTLFTPGPTLYAVVVGLVLAGAAVAGLARLGHGWAVVTAGVRAGLQLGAVALVITQVATRLWATLLFIAAMYAVAGWTAASRLRRARWAVLPVVGGTVPVLLLLVGTGLVPPHGLALIPVAGILVGGAMTVTALAGRRCTDELETRRGEVEAALALGFSDRQAALEVCRPAASTSLIPALDQTRTVGLVTLPGAFVGMLLGGASPTQAAIVQMVVLVALLAVQTVAVALTTEFVVRAAGK